MAIPPDEREVVEAHLASLYSRRVPQALQGQRQLLHELRGNSITMSERRAAWRRPREWTDFKIAQFRYSPSTGEWALFWRDRNESWHSYPNLEPTATAALMTILLR